MNLFQLFSDEQQRLLFGVAIDLDLAAGDILIYRGDPGGDVYLLETGLLEIVDVRTTPEVILATLEPGAIVGEMGFVDQAPRSANVRAASPCHIKRWPGTDLRYLLREHPKLGTAFYQELARVATERLRSLSHATFLGPMVRSVPPSGIGVAGVTEQIAAIVASTKEGLIGAETKLRQVPSDYAAVRQVHHTMDQFQEHVRNVLISYPDPDSGKEISNALTKELHPYLVRSTFAEYCMRRPQGTTGTAEMLAHVLNNKPSGDGKLGEVIDRWFLDRPTLVSHRNQQITIAKATVATLPTHRDRSLLLLNASTTSLVAGLTVQLGEAPTLFTIVDHRREALAYIEATVQFRPPTVEIQTVQESLGQLSRGRTRHVFPPQDAVIMTGLVEYMPDRVAISAIETASALLKPGGSVVIGALAPSEDAYLLDRVLNWPTIRRSPQVLRRIIAGAGLEVTREVVTPRPALLVLAQKPNAA